MFNICGKIKVMAGENHGLVSELCKSVAKYRAIL
jgi:hypothetical protein